MGMSGSLLTCLQEQELGNSYESERQLLYNLGIKTSSSLETAIVYRGLFDILVAVNQKSGDIILSSASVEKLQELVVGNYVIPRDGNFIYEQDLISSIQYFVINDYIQKGQYHFVKISPKEKISSCFLCSLGTFKPYPDFSGYDVYTLSAVSNLVRSYERELDKGYLKLSLKSGNEIIVCTRQRISSSSKKLMSVPTPYCKLYAYDLSGSLLQIPIFDISSVESYYTSQFEKDLSEGIVCIGGKNYTNNRDILSRYYGDWHYRLETNAVLSKWALDDILSGGLNTVEQVMSKYGLNKSPYFPNISNFSDLVEYLTNLVEGSAVADHTRVVGRVLANVGLVTSGKVSYYRTIKLSSIPEYTVIPVEKVLPQMVRIAGVSTNFGYQVSTAKVYDGCDIRKTCTNEFIRQFGDLVSPIEIYTDYTKGEPLVLSLYQQRILADHLNAGDYVNNFNDYYKVISTILDDNKVPWYNEASVKHLFVNTLVKSLRDDFRKRGCKEKAYINNYGVFGVELCKYIRLVKSMNETKHKGYLVNVLRRYPSFENVLKENIKLANKASKSRSGSYNDRMRYTIHTINNLVLIHSKEVEHTILVHWSINVDGSVSISDRYESSKEV